MSGYISTYVVDSSFELDLQSSLARVIDLLTEVKCDALALLIVRDVLGRLGGIANLQLSAEDLELVGIEDQLRETIVLCDLCVDADGTLVAELAAELDVVEGDSVVGGFGPTSSC